MNPKPFPASLSGLKKRLNEIVEEEAKLLYDFDDDPEIQRINEAFRDLSLQKEIRKAQITDDRSNAIAGCQMAISSVMEAIKKLNEASLSSKVKDVLEGICRNVTYDSKWRCSWLSESGDYGILSKTGGTHWNGIGASRASHPAEHYLLDIRKMRLYMANNVAFSSLTLLDKIGRIDNVEGRLSKEKKAEWFFKVKELELANEKYL